MPYRNSLILGTVAASGITLLCAAYYFYKHWIQPVSVHIPKKWKEVGIVSKLVIYPLKSGSGIEVEEAECNWMGLQHGGLRDRTILVVDSKKSLVTARQEPKLLKLKLAFKNNVLIISAPGMEDLQVFLQDSAGIVKCRVWKNYIDAYDLGDEVANWLSTYLYGEMSSVRLVQYSNTAVQKNFLPGSEFGDLPMAKKDDGCAFHDISAYMLVSEASIEDLNAKLEKKVSHCNFRPNIIVKDCAAFAEEDWCFVRIGDAVFRNVKLCARCVFTTIDHETLERSKTREPLTTLESYHVAEDPIQKRYSGKSGIMGIHLSPDQLGNIKSGDKVFASIS